ncbi:hypothetical protein [Streptomyces iranensis]|uniref:Benzoate:H+ symporter BenE n=1 Tax=Streptomyces iranensis TaxID=576784 RepID=A0A061A703_9ACTN|nr:hypothetical protein [Streptomyces iranensis]MBP2060107.1 putative benzoate:H+ symporter BenE [Streptomyces iranensis]CDR13953.1 predicted protein [Streptomyces iranensis]
MPENHPPRTSAGRGLELLLDLRSIIAALFGIYGVVLTVMGAAGPSRAELHKAGGWNVNLWCGIAMLVVTALFGGWAVLRPVRVQPGSERDLPEHP